MVFVLAVNARFDSKSNFFSRRVRIEAKFTSKFSSQLQLTNKLTLVAETAK
jgi:hypothetical protein